MTKRKSIKAQSMSDTPRINSIVVYGTRFIPKTPPSQYHDYYGIVLNNMLNGSKDYFLAASNFVYGVNHDEKHSYTKEQLKRVLIVCEANEIGIDDAYIMDNDSLISLILQKYEEFEMSLNNTDGRSYNNNNNNDEAHPMTEREYREYWSELLKN